MTRADYIGELFDCAGSAIVHYPHVTGFKREGTSSEAAPDSKRANALRDRVLAALRVYVPMTADEIASALGEDRLSIRPRCSELIALGKIKETGQRRPNASGKMAAVLEAIILCT